MSVSARAVELSKTRKLVSVKVWDYLTTAVVVGLIAVYYISLSHVAG